ncbi:hypothetical protein QA648_21565 (plasmid) [Rhizobium sp. CB3171]|uniref:hypothetical protein n=1 Tax=Rhizobium sp. CB3171 TaxID=3039157 RepID=UPI0024B0BDCF|nr:hypothetical protein [Rhizobium sp. CB3171]WFU05758.1 hypothetical protein QA648_21565 [Rhizobium sp. CB3171]
MTSQSIEVYGFKLPPGEFTIIVGESSLAIFNKFLNGRFAWAISGIDWTKSNYISQYKVEKGRDIIACLTEMRTRHRLSGKYSLWFEHEDAVLITGDLKILCDMVSFFDEHPTLASTDFWIFSESTGECLEIYHEDLITLGAAETPRS